MTDEGMTRRLMSRWRSILDGVAVVLMIAASAAMLWSTLGRRAGGTSRSNRPGLHLPSEPVSLVGATLEGKPTASVAMVVYTDFQCPFCRSFAQNTLPSLVRDYVSTGKVILAVRQVPLERIHRFARAAAQAAECAARDGKFWEMHDQLFMTNLPLDEDGIRERARVIGLGSAAFESCVHGDTAAAMVQVDLDAARSVGIAGTPAFQFGTVDRTGRVRVSRVLSGAAPLATFRSTLDQLIAGGK